jgi:hypothetical protein
MKGEQLVKLELARKTEVFWENLPESYVIPHKPHMT